MPEPRHVGRVQLSESMFLEWLQYKGGRILAIQWDVERLAIVLVLEHPEMPEVRELEPIQEVWPNYTQTTGPNGELLSIQRVKPEGAKP